MNFKDPEIIFRYFEGLLETQISSFNKLGGLYEVVNSKINLISRADFENLYLRHILHSLSIAKFIWFKEETRVLDLGTGGGLPGIPLAILFPKVHFTLIDSIQKKTKMVSFLADELGLNNVEVVCDRAENIDEQFDFVVSRATAPMSDLVKWTKDNFLLRTHNSYQNGIIALKGGNLVDELKYIKKEVDIVSLSDYFDEDFFSTKKLLYLRY